MAMVAMSGDGGNLATAPARTGVRLATIDVALEVKVQRKAHEHSHGSGDRHRDQHAYEAEQVAEHEQRKDQPHRMQPDLGADDVGARNPASSTCAPMKMPTTSRIGRYSGQNCTTAMVVAVIKPSAQPTNGTKLMTPVASPTSRP